MIVLAGDIGGTNSRLALFAAERARQGEGTPTLTPIHEHTYPSTALPTLEQIVEAFVAEARAKAGDQVRLIPRACLGIAGPVENNICRATNLPWIVDGKAMAALLGIERLQLVNDIQAAALGVTAVGPSYLVGLGGAPPVARGPIAVLGAGTGLGEAFLVWSAHDSTYQVIASEGGHADLAARTPLEMALLQFLTIKYGRASYERVLSGQGLVDTFSFLAQEPACASIVRDETRSALAAHGPGHDPAAVITRRGLDGADPVCEMALAIFSSVLGALAGNLALYTLATGGVFIAGGIAPRILPHLQRGGFREAFERKGRLTPLVAKLPAFVVTHPQPGLLGAATIAAGL
ncbi:MAG TPA: glucokinase [Polyangia bacterium]|nr:glucokinase [Polyangia bacterium]